MKILLNYGTHIKWQTNKIVFQHRRSSLSFASKNNLHLCKIRAQTRKRNPTTASNSQWAQNKRYTIIIRKLFEKLFGNFLIYLSETFFAFAGKIGQSATNWIKG